MSGELTGRRRADAIRSMGAILDAAAVLLSEDADASMSAIDEGIQQ